MTRYYQRKKPGTNETLRAGLVAGGVAAAVAAVSFYLTRVYLSREALEPLDSRDLSEPTDPREIGTRRDGI